MPEVRAFEGSQDGLERVGDTVVGHDVWIGSEAMIMPGVRIGEGAVIASRALVSKDVAPYSIVGGNPAGLLKHRFTAEQIAILLDIQWWYWPESILSQAMRLLCSSQVKALFEFYQQNREHIKTASLT